MEGQVGFCRASAHAVYSSTGPHRGEEPVLSGWTGSGTIFLTRCNSRCIFCQNADISQLAHGSPITVEELAEIYPALQQMGCHNVNFVTPAHYLPHLVSALVLAVERGFSLPLVYNSNGYDSVEVLRLLDGIIDIYLPDMKFNNARTAYRLSRLLDYPEINRKAIAEMYRQVGLLETDENGIAKRGLIVRHLVLPNNLSGTRGVMKAIAAIDKRITVNLMDQYRPCFRAIYEQQLNRRITRREFEEAQKAAENAGLVNVWT
jgi:putative pyruvate formate lyase activating enzyme